METSHPNKTHFHKGPQERESLSLVSFMRMDSGAQFQQEAGGGGVLENSPGGGGGGRGVRARAGEGGWSRSISPKQILKSRGSEMVFSIFSMRYFSKKTLSWIGCKMTGTSGAKSMYLYT